MHRGMYGPFFSLTARLGRFGKRREEPLPTGGPSRHSLRHPGKSVPDLALFPSQTGGTARPEPVPPPRKRPYPRPSIPDIVPDIYRLYDSGHSPTAGSRDKLPQLAITRQTEGNGLYEEKSRREQKETGRPRPSYQKNRSPPKKKIRVENR